MDGEHIRHHNREPLSDADLRQIHLLEEFGLFCDYDEFEQIARAIEQALGYAQDRDLWQFRLNQSREVSARIAIQPRTFKAWYDLIAMGIPALAAEGEIILHHTQDQVEKAVSRSFSISVLDMIVPCANVPYYLASDVGEALCKTQDGAAKFSVTYFDCGTVRHWSLRSGPNGMNVSEIAAKLGGGGHAHAAGFKTKINPVVVPDENSPLDEDGYFDEDLALSIFLRDGLLFAFDFKDEDGISRIKLSVNCNDVFLWGSADAEPFYTQDIPEMWKWYQKDKYNGLTIWACLHRGMRPQVPLIAILKEANSWVEELEALPPSAYDNI